MKGGRLENVTVFETVSHDIALGTVVEPTKLSTTMFRVVELIKFVDTVLQLEIHTYIKS